MAIKDNITVRGYPTVDEQRTAAEAITPGALITVNASGQWINHNVAGGNATPTFALEREEAGKDVDDAYSTGETVKAGTFHSGDKVNALIAAGQNLTPDDFLESAGDGTVRLVAASAATSEAQREGVVARSDESTDGAVAAQTRHLIRIA